MNCTLYNPNRERLLLQHKFWGHFYFKGPQSTYNSKNYKQSCNTGILRARIPELSTLRLAKLFTEQVGKLSVENADSRLRHRHPNALSFSVSCRHNYHSNCSIRKTLKQKYFETKFETQNHSGLDSKANYISLVGEIVTCDLRNLVLKLQIVGSDSEI